MRLCAWSGPLGKSAVGNRMPAFRKRRKLYGIWMSLGTCPLSLTSRFKFLKRNCCLSPVSEVSRTAPCCCLGPRGQVWGPGAPGRGRPRAGRLHLWDRSRVVFCWGVLSTTWEGEWGGREIFGIDCRTWIRWWPGCRPCP